MMKTLAIFLLGILTGNIAHAVSYLDNNDGTISVIQDQAESDKEDAETANRIAILTSQRDFYSAQVISIQGQIDNIQAEVDAKVQAKGQKGSPVPVVKP